MKKKFEVVVMRTDTYTIEFDTDVMNEEWMEQFKETEYEFVSLQEHAQHIAQFRARFCNSNIYGGFIDGYGNIALKGHVKPYVTFPFPAVNIIKADEDNNIDVDVTELGE